MVASMTAGILASRGESPAALVLVAPGSVIQDACKGGRFFGAEFNPSDPPEYVKCFGIMKLGREYILTTQELDIYGTAKAYTGPVRLIHGSKDTISSPDLLKILKRYVFQNYCNPYKNCYICWKFPTNTTNHGR